MNTITLGIDELRDIITGKTKFRKCLKCDANGLIYWDAEGVATLPYVPEGWNGDYESGPCDMCGGLGYVEKTKCN